MDTREETYAKTQEFRRKVGAYVEEMGTEESTTTLDGRPLPIYDRLYRTLTREYRDTGRIDNLIKHLH